MHFTWKFPFFKRKAKYPYHLLGAAAVLLGLFAGLASEGAILKGDLSASLSEDFQLTEVGVDEGDFIYGMVTNTSGAELDIELALLLEGEFVASSGATFEPGETLQLSPGVQLESGSHHVELCASSELEETCLKETLSL